jgi:HPr kinase/phosphorylase
MAERQIPCLVLTRNYNPTRAMLEVAQEKKLPLFETPMITMNWVNLGTLHRQRICPVRHRACDHPRYPRRRRACSAASRASAKASARWRSSNAATRWSPMTCTVIRLLDERELMASSRPLNRGYMECRGIGIINVADMFGVKSIRLEKRIDMVVSLHEWHPDAIESAPAWRKTTMRSSDSRFHTSRSTCARAATSPGSVEVAAFTQALEAHGTRPREGF